VHAVTDTRANNYYYLLLRLYGCFFDLGRLCIFKPGPNHSLVRVRGRTTYFPFALSISGANLRTYMWAVFLQVGGLHRVFRKL
jgi:hypothetical protein